MDYASFKSHLTTFLWRDGDTVLIANLDSLIKMADAEINRVLKIEDRTVTAAIVATSDNLPVPLGYREMRTLSHAGGPMANVSPLEFARLNGLNTGGAFLPIFCVSNQTLRLSGPYSVETPIDFTIVYYADIPDFKTTDESWLAEDYLDLYTYCCLKHAAPFLREDDRLQVWGSLYKEALQGALDENANRKYAGSPQTINYSGMM